MQEITCPLCGRRTPLAAGATMACPSCGAPLVAPALASSASALASAEDDSATRPSILLVDSEARDIADVTTNVTQPANLLDDGDTTNVTKTAAEVTADFPMPPAPARTQTIPAQAMPSTESQTQPAIPFDAPAALPGSPAAGTSAAPDKPAATARRRAPSGLIAILALIVLLLIFGGAGVLLANGRLPFFSASPTVTASATATVEPTATSSSNLTIFTDSGNVFRVGHPNGWLQTIQDTQSPRLVIFSNPTTGANFNVGTYASTGDSAQQVADSALAVLAQKTGVANRSGPTTAFIAGQTWTQESGDVTVEQNGKLTPMHAVALATIHGGNTVYVLELAPVDTFPTIDPTFQQILQSFEFLS